MQMRLVVLLLFVLFYESNYVVSSSIQQAGAPSKGQRPTDVGQPSSADSTKAFCRKNRHECVCGKIVYDAHIEECIDGQVVCINELPLDSTARGTISQSRITKRAVAHRSRDASAAKSSSGQSKGRLCRPRDGVIECQCGSDGIFYNDEQTVCFNNEPLQRSLGCSTTVPFNAEPTQYTLERNSRVSNRSVTVFQHFTKRLTHQLNIPNRVPEAEMSDIRNKLHAVFVENDPDEDGWMAFAEFQIFLSALHLRMSSSDVRLLFNEIAGRVANRLQFQTFYRYYEQMIQGEKRTHSGPEIALLSAFLKADHDGLCEMGGITKYINARWKSFNGFRRNGTNGKLVMTGGDVALDVLPGEYTLVDFIASQNLLPTSRTPKFARILGVQWSKSNTSESESGQLIFPKQFVNIRLPVELATDEKLAYYGCLFADRSQVRVSLLHRHAIQNFTYHDNYYRDYVRGRAGLERHDFAHLDQPFDINSGYFILGKFNDQSETELHVTAFKIPTGSTLYVPPMTIHSNDYLKGTWRTMLSDATHIDHVRLERRRYDNELDQIAFDFNV